MDRLWGEVLPVPAGRVRELAGRRAACSPVGASSRSRDAWTRVAPRQLFRSIERRGVRRRHGRHQAWHRHLHHAADAAAGHRSRGLARERRPHPGVGSGHAVPHALRALPWRPDALPGALRAPRRVERGSSAGCLRTRRSTIQERERRFVEEGRQDIRRTVGATEAEQYRRAGRLDYSWQGLARYWRSRLG